MSQLDARDQIIAELEQTVSMLLSHNTELMDMVKFQKESSELSLETAVLQNENALRQEFNGEMTRLKSGLQQSIAILKAARKAKGATNASELETLQRQVDSLSSLVQTALNGGYDRPLLSLALEEWIAIRGNLGIDPKKVKTDRNRILDFVAFSGDAPVNKYHFYDFQRFASMLVFLPGNYMKRPEFQGRSQEDIANTNRLLPQEEQVPGLAAKTIDTNYLSPLRMFFRDVGAQYSFRSPLENVEIRISASATESVERGPLEISDLNKWFRFSAKEDRADSKWLPLLATLTGARIGELICLQGKDVYPVTSKIGDQPICWVIDLRSEMVLESGFKEKRKIKNKSSRRLIALHRVFLETGFIEYASGRGSTDNVFPAAFYHGEDKVARPADAASKRMNYSLQKLGIHKKLETTFHSTRHTAKDFMRLAKVDERTHDKQTGHALGNVSRNYGSKYLVGEELEVLSELPLPDDLDLSPYYDSLLGT
jgi:integrase